MCVYMFIYNDSFTNDTFMVKLKLLMKMPMNSIHRSMSTLPPRPRFILSSDKAQPALDALCIFSFAFGREVQVYLGNLPRKTRTYADAQELSLVQKLHNIMGLTSKENCSQPVFNHQIKTVLNQFSINCNLFLQIFSYSTRFNCMPRQHSACMGVISHTYSKYKTNK